MVTDLLSAMGAIVGVIAVNVVTRRVDAWRWGKEEAEEAEAVAAEEARKTVVTALGMSYLNGALAGIRASAGPMYPGKAEEVKTLLGRCGIRDGAALGVARADNWAPMVARVNELSVEWDEAAEDIAVRFGMKAEPLVSIERE